MTTKRSFGIVIPLALTTLLFFGNEAASQKASQPASEPPAKTQVAPTKPTPHAQDEGDIVFQQHCSRCHTAPDGFSPRISGTVLRHMRVRASLSEQDEQQLLRFLNP
jgi:cytochrome c5